MQWLLTAVVVGAACWMVAALTIESDKSFGEILKPRLRAAGRSLGNAVRIAGGMSVRAVSGLARASAGALNSFGRASARAFSRVFRTIGRVSVRGSHALGSRLAGLRSVRTERRNRRRVAQRQSLDFERTALVTGPERPEQVVTGSLPILNLSPSDEPPPFSRLLAFLQLLFLVVLWGGGAALAIAGAAWAVTRIV